MHKIVDIIAPKIFQNHQKINDFFVQKFSKKSPLFYNSVDLRHSGFKIAPVDTNCFPAGFNNLSKDGKNVAQKCVDDFFAKNFAQVKKVLIIPENHTRNIRYFENLVALKDILEASKKEVLIGSLNPEIQAETRIEIDNQSSLILYPVIKNNDVILTKSGFTPEIILLNNDLTDGIPEVLQNILTPIIPSAEMGWYRRSKSDHFDIYNNFANEISDILQIDPWLISSFNHRCDEVDFKEQVGLECLANYVDKMIEKITEKYQQYGVDEKPYCFVKADNGTYGMAVWAVNSGTEILEINKKERNKMNMLKGSTKTHKVMIQEGIKTVDKIGNDFCEPMIYMINGQVIENLFRVNAERDEKISLNAGGARFCRFNDISKENYLIKNQESFVAIYQLVARLAALSSSYES